MAGTIIAVNHLQHSNENERGWKVSQNFIHLHTKGTDLHVNELYTLHLTHLPQGSFNSHIYFR